MVSGRGMVRDIGYICALFGQSLQRRLVLAVFYSARVRLWYGTERAQFRSIILCAS